VGKYELYRPDPLQYQRRAEFGDQLSLVGWSVDAGSHLMPGDSITLIAVWRAEQEPSRDYTSFAHLVDTEGRGWAGDDHEPYGGRYPTSAWAAGEMVRDRFEVVIPDDAPPGLYDLLVGWYPSSAPPDSQDRLPVGAGNAFRVAVLPVAGPGFESDALDPVHEHFGEAVTLEGYSVRQDTSSVHVTLRWSASEVLDTDFAVFLHLVEPGGTGDIVAQSDDMPLKGRWPTSLWLPGVSLDDQHTIALPQDLHEGVFSLLVGLYDPDTGARLPLASGGDALLLGEVDLR
jgi:hypothetical protein